VVGPKYVRKVDIVDNEHDTHSTNVEELTLQLVICSFVGSSSFKFLRNNNFITT
jgi:hypothetical protein